MLLFQFLHTFRGLRSTYQNSTSLFFLKFDLLKTLLTIRQNSLYVTVCMIASTSYQGYFIHSLSTLHYCNAPSLATQLTGDYRDRTYTGKCGPASLDTLRKKVIAQRQSLARISCLFYLIFRQKLFCSFCSSSSFIFCCINA